MHSITSRSVFSLAEMAVGLVSAALGSYFLFLNLDCPPEVGGECTAWGWLGAAMFLFPGIIVLVAGALSYFWKSMPLVKIQLGLIGILVAYFVWGFVLP